MDLTLYEQHDLLISQQGLLLENFMFYLTLLSAYLVVAYVAGKKLTTFQVWTVSVIYTVFASLTAVSALVAGGRASEMESQLYPALDIGEADSLFGVLGAVILFGAMLMSLMFMWKVRTAGD